MDSLAHTALTVTVVAHFLYLAFVITGWMYCARSAFWRTAHIAAVLYGVLIEWLLFPCPLTNLENLLRRRVWGTTYGGTFIDHYLEQLIYFQAPQSVLIAGAILLLGVTIWRYRRYLRFRRTAASST